MAQCEFEKAGGQRCEAPALTGSKLCFFHNPSEAAKRREAQSAGGLASSQGRSPSEWNPVEPLALDTIEGILQVVTEQLDELRGLEPSPRKGTAIFYGVGLLVRLYEVLVLEKRLSEMERFHNVGYETWLLAYPRAK